MQTNFRNSTSGSVITKMAAPMTVSRCVLRRFIRRNHAFQCLRSATSSVSKLHESKAFVGAFNY